MVRPGRGRWSRRQSPEERRLEQRAALLRAAAAAAAEHGADVTVAHIVEAAGTGRNTFYEHFDDVATALVASRSLFLEDLLARLDTAVAEVRTPLGRLRTFATAWLDEMRRDPEGALSVWRTEGTGGLAEALRARLDDHLLRTLVVARQAGAVGVDPDPVRVRILGGAFEAAARAVAASATQEIGATAEILVEMSLRAFR